MKTIELALEPITGYLVSIKRNTVNGCYELEIGLPAKWEFGDNDEIKCEVLIQNDDGKLVKISPKNSDIVIDDLVAFVEIIIHTNGKIVEKEKQFTDRMQEMKGMLEKEAKKFYEELDELKISSFRNINDAFQKNLRNKEEKPKRIKTPKVVVNDDTNTSVEPTKSTND